MDLLALLEDGNVDEFNLQRGERAKLDYFAVDLSGRNLAGVDLSRANLDKADLSKVDLSEASLYKTSMTGIDGTELVLRRALATKLRLKEAWLDKADLTEAELSRADFKEAVLTHTRGERVRLINARLLACDAKHAVWPQAELMEASLTKGDYTGADMRQADMTDANAGGATFHQARLDSVIASRLRAPGAVFTEASLMGARLEEANLLEADLTGCDLSAADLTGANLTDAILVGAKLDGAILADAILDGADFTDASLEGVDLSGVDPRAIGLTDEQLQSLASVGATYDPDAPLRVEDLVAGRQGEHVAGLWLNADNEVMRTLRYGVARMGDEMSMGVLPTSPEGLLAKAVVPLGDGFAIVLFQERPGGTAVIVYPLDTAGELGASRSYELGYKPAILPVVRGDAEGLFIWGMSRRGPTLIVHRMEGEEFAPVHSEKVATARGFLGQHKPVLVCKGGVVMPVTHTGAGSPLRAPEGFPGPMANAGAYQSRVLGTWVERGVSDDDPGGIRTAWLERRSGPEIETLTFNDAVTAIDLLPTSGGVWLAWIELGDTGGPVVKTIRLPGAGVAQLPLDEGIVPTDVRFAPGALTEGDDAPALVVTSDDGSAALTDVDGRPTGAIEGGGALPGVSPEGPIE